MTSKIELAFNTWFNDDAELLTGRCLFPQKRAIPATMDGSLHMPTAAAPSSLDFAAQFASPCTPLVPAILVVPTFNDSIPLFSGVCRPNFDVPDPILMFPDPILP